MSRSDALAQSNAYTYMNVFIVTFIVVLMDTSSISGISPLAPAWWPGSVPMSIISSLHLRMMHTVLSVSGTPSAGGGFFVAGRVSRYVHVCSERVSSSIRAVSQGILQ